MTLSQKINDATEFEDYQNAVETLAAQKNIACERELIQSVLSVLAYHKTTKHANVQKSVQDLGRDLTPLYYINLSDDMDWFTKGQLKGFIKFVESFAEGKRPLDLSDFFLASGFDYQIAMGGCEAYLPYVQKDEDAQILKKLTYLISVFDALWKLKMDARRILGRIAAWDDESLKTVTDFMQAHEETEFDVLLGLSMNDSDAQMKLLTEKVVLPHLNILKKRRDKLNKIKRNTEDDSEKRNIGYRTEAIGELIAKLKDWYPDVKLAKKQEMK